MANLLKRSAAIIVALTVILGMMPVMTGKAHAAAPSAPTNVKLENYRNDYGEWGVYVTWTASSGAAGYKVFRGPYTATSESDFTELASSATTNTYFHDKTAKHGEKYKYAVKARDNNYAYSSLSTPSSIFTADFTPKTYPTPGTATVDGNSVTLTWSGNDFNVSVAEVQYTGMVYVPSKVWKESVSGTSYTLTGLEYDTEYTFGICYTNTNGTGPYKAYTKVKTGSKPSGGEGGDSGGGDSGVTPPSWDAGEVKFYSTTPGTTTVKATSFDYISIEVRQGNTVIINDYLAYYGSKEVTVKIPYVGSTAFKYRFYDSVTGATTAWRTVNASSIKLAKPTLSVTKIAAGSAGLSWDAVKGATGYKVYKGKKLVKTLGAGKTKYVYKKKKAGTAKYSVSAVIKSAGKTYEGPKSKAKKGKANFRKYSGSKNYNSVKYGVAPFSITKIELSGNTYTVTGYVLNNRMFKMLRYKKLEITLFCDGKKVAHKKWKNLKVNCKDYASKKLVLKIKGKGGKDFRNATGTTYNASWTPYWQSVGDKAF